MEGLMYSRVAIATVGKRLACAPPMRKGGSMGTHVSTRSRKTTVISPSFAPLVSELAERTGIVLPALSLEQATMRLIQQRIPIKRLTNALASTERKRYIVAPLLHQQASGTAARESLLAVNEHAGGAVLRSLHDEGAKVLSLSPLEATVLKERFSNLLIEEDFQYRLAGRTPIIGEIDVIATPAAQGRRFRVRVRGNGKGTIRDAEVILMTDVAKKRAYVGRTNARGVATFTIRKSERKFEKVLVLPRSGFWSRIYRDVKVSAVTFEASVDPNPAGGYDWGPIATEAAGAAWRGDGVKVAIIDSGISRHRHLRVVGGRNFIVGEDPSAWDNDLDGHGTHCAGVVAALLDQGSTWGYAPNAEIYALRVFGGADGGGYASDIGDSIDWAIDQGCDIISMSLTSETPSSYIRTRIERAFDSGVLCVAATGNEARDVGYPARFRGVVGVSAIGKQGTYPADSIHREAESTIRSADGRYYLAGFSNRGAEVDMCAPGVAVTSTIPTDAFSALDGTSMACPQITGIAALVLQASLDIRNAPRDAARMTALFDRLQRLCVDLGMGSSYQGSGMPSVTRLQPIVTGGV